MNAPIAPPDPSTRKTSAIATVTTASSTTPQRIDDFIKRKLSEADSDAGSGIIDSAARAAQLGFVNAANVRYSAFLEAFRSSPQLTETYREKYPSSLFLPWTALHAVIKALDLWVDLPEFYAGAVPPEQLPWMEIFELDPSDRMEMQELPDLVGRDWETLRLAGLHLHLLRRGLPGLDVGLYGVSGHQAQSAIILAGRLARPCHDLETSFFVAAPQEAFTTDKDWIARVRSLTTPEVGPTVAPDDPLVIRFCHGGALVVAAWGDEAAELNEITKELKL